MSRKDSSQDVTLLATQEKRTITINKNRVGIAKSLGMGQDDCKERKGKGVIRTILYLISNSGCITMCISYNLQNCTLQRSF